MKESKKKTKVATTMEEKSDWASAPIDILECVLRKLGSIEDYILFGRVCHSWHHVLEQQELWQDLALARTPQLPLLMVPSDEPDSNSVHRRTNKGIRFYNVFNGKTYTVPLNLSYNLRCCGSSHGWLVVNIGSFYKSITLINPTAPFGTRRRNIKLPLITKKGRRPFIYKFVLSRDPDLVPPQDCVVAAIYGESRNLAFMRLSEENWTYVDRGYINLDDVVFGRDGRLYAVEIHGSLISINLAVPGRIYDCGISTTFFNYGPCKVYTVISAVSGDVLLVRRLGDVSSRFGKTRFLVYRLVQGKDGWSWVDMERLDNEVLFVGGNQSMSFSCDDIGRLGCKPNSIYYTNDIRRYDEQVGIDVGVYHMEDGSCKPTYIPGQNNFPLPIFIVPKLS